jgi:hypothetical protein
MKTKITLKTAIKAKNFDKKFERFCWENETKLTCFNFVVGKGITLVWLEEPCFENYVEMVAGLPRDTKMIKNFLIN